MKLGGGAAVAAALGTQAPAQEMREEGASKGPALHSMRAPGEMPAFTGPGYKYTFDRLGNNGPMDDTSAKIVKFVHDFKATDVTPAAKHQFDRTMIDSLASIVAGFELEESRISAKMAKDVPPGELKCTMLGYNVATTPELATFANGVLIRETDFNDTENR